MPTLRFSIAAVAAVAAVWLEPGLAAAAPLPDTSPPAGIKPASVSLAYVLNANAAAEGRLAFGVAQTRAEHWKLSYGSLDGTRDDKTSGRDYRIDTVLGPTHTAEGRIGATQWHMNANGQILIESGMHRSDDVDRAAMRAQGHPGVSLLGQVDAPVAAYVVKVDPPGGRLAYFFYDRKTFLLDREEEIRDGRRVAETLDDYRTTKGLTEPWHLHTTDGFATNDEDELLQSLAIGDPIAAADLAIPAGSSPLYSPAAPSASIPIAMDSDRIVVPVKMGGHTVNFLLDSGAEGIVIDKDVVEALKIPEYGRVTAETAGAYLSSDVVIPSMTIGSLELSNVHATSLPFVSVTSSGRPVAGLLGYDFIRNAVLHIDYQHATLEAIPAAAFTPPPGARAFPVTFDDGVPTIAVTIGAAAAPAFIVDTGADRSALFSTFANAHPKDVADRGLGTAMQAAFPFVDNFSGVGGSVEYRPVQVGPFVLGSWTFPKWLFVVTQNAASFEFEDYDGLIGQDVLRNFDVYLDYAHGKIYLVPNERFHQRW
jgi:Aspartyl protease